MALYIGFIVLVVISGFFMLKEIMNVPKNNTEKTPRANFWILAFFISAALLVGWTVIDNQPEEPKSPEISRNTNVSFAYNEAINILEEEGLKSAEKYCNNLNLSNAHLSVVKNKSENQIRVTIEYF